jgi:hypothetical protein
MTELNALTPRSRPRAATFSQASMHQPSDCGTRPGGESDRDHCEPTAAECHLLAAVLHPMGVEGACFDDAPLTPAEISAILNKTCGNPATSEVTA